ncbi:hypothetical protein IKP94_04495 [Candidatus Saccharibacteria bacterium]|nr:hypothetical protein [Candidatus Saccharibacteria bacterium]
MEDDTGSNRRDGLQEEQSKEPVFHSKDIKQEKTEYFVRVEGAEQRKKEMLRRMKQQKESLIKAKKEQENAAKRAERQEKFHTKVTAHRQKREAFFARHKKTVIAAVVVILVIIGVLVAYYFMNPPLTQEEIASNESIARNIENQEDFINQLDEKYAEEGSSYQSTMEWAEEEIRKTDDKGIKFDYYSAMTSFSINVEGHAEDALKYADEMEKLATNDGERLAVYSFKSVIYLELGNMEKNEEYEQKANKLREIIDRIDEDNTYD